MSFIFKSILLVNLGIPAVICQIDLGSFSLGQNKRGDLKFIFNQAANILGFGGDRGVDLTIGEGRFNTKARQGALIAGERISADSGININEAEGVDFRNFLNFNNSPISFNNPVGLFLSFLEKIKNFFTTDKRSDVIRFPTQYENSDVEIGSVSRNFETSEQQRISGETVNYRQPENDDYYHNVEVEDEAAQKQFKTTSESSGKENWDIMNRSIIGTEFNTTIT
ncbi:unnamed protein product [Cercopithifilaria johnstoni]|uniref:Uncharacterized protein n=1 Tax=Cercopithifilaria johnstoni TaxID=2874296 RepID=A0A8J2Q7F7_9BILA|nr:unnamed protein product [Cercopithifilaria johnstoni]